MTCEAVLAAVLLVMPPLPLSESGKHPDPRLTPLVAVLTPSLVTFAIDAEIIDHRETTLSSMASPWCDLASLQTRAELMRGAPHLGEWQRLPDRKRINDLMALNRVYRNHLQARLVVDLLHAEELQNAISETDRAYQIWDAARDSSCEYYYVTVRRQAMELLRELIGPEAFYSGEMPPHVPVRHLPRR